MTPKTHATVATYFAMRHPAKVGQTRTMKWSTLVPPSGPEDKMWTERCTNYWTRQAEVYGLKFSAFTFWFNPRDNTVVTAAQVVDILPGERVIV
jgi:hypothetical protein